MSSLDSANGPSVTVGRPPEKDTRAPREVGCRPSSASSTPASLSCWLKAPIASAASADGPSPYSASLTLGFMKRMNRAMSSLPGGCGGRLYSYDERPAEQ